MKKIGIWLGLSILMMILWIVGAMIGNAVFPSSLMEMETENTAASGLLFLLVSALNAGIILHLIYQSRYRGWKLVISVFLISFGIQYFMSQIETLWFNDSLGLPVMGIAAIVFGGAITLFLFTLIAIWITGKLKSAQDKSDASKPVKFNVKKIILLSIVIWPIIYFTFGYYVAWQFADIRLFYSGNTEMESLASMMKENILSGLYLFQIFRGFIWVFIGLLVLKLVKGSRVSSSILLGLLFTILSCSGLLLENPFMPEMVRLGHLLETSTSNFIWGFLMAWVLWRPVSGKASDLDAKML